mmetsp:Transcript_32583/g.112696  ORF Transcript_32583/g.112696 Transcript_32583/m.112696 type:complete len:322 (+) Transcript_32583:825-1790(+)
MYRPARCGVRARRRGAAPAPAAAARGGGAARRARLPRRRQSHRRAFTSESARGENDARVRARRRRRDGVHQPPAAQGRLRRRRGRQSAPVARHAPLCSERVPRRNRQRPRLLRRVLRRAAAFEGAHEARDAVLAARAPRRRPAQGLCRFGLRAAERPRLRLGSRRYGNGQTRRARGRQPALARPRLRLRHLQRGRVLWRRRVLAGQGARAVDALRDIDCVRRRDVPGVSGHRAGRLAPHVQRPHAHRRPPGRRGLCGRGRARPGKGGPPRRERRVPAACAAAVPAPRLGRGPGGGRCPARRGVGCVFVDVQGGRRCRRNAR